MPLNDPIIKKNRKMTLKEKLLHNDFGYRLMLGLLALIFLTLFFHIKEIKVEMLELDTIANKYVVSQVDFEFPDEESTLLLKEQAARDIGTIYQIDGGKAQQMVYAFNDYLTNNNDWEKRFPTASYEDFYMIANVFEDVLSSLRFVDSKTLQKMRDLNVSTKHYLVYRPSNLQKPVLYKDYWKNLKQVYLQKELMVNLKDESPEMIRFVIRFFENYDWPLIQDKDTEKLFKELIEQDIPQKYARVKAGTRIIDQGEKVQAKHIAMLKSMKQALSERRNLLNPITILGNFFLACIFLFLGYLYLNVEQKEIIKSLQKLSLVISILILTLVFSKVVEYILLNNQDSVIEAIHYPVFVPFATFLFCMLVNSKLSLFASLYLSVILTISLAVNQGEFLVINTVLSLLVMVLARNLRKRNEVFKVIGKSFLGAIPLILTFEMITPNFSFSILLGNIIFVLGSLGITAILVIGFLPLLESLFNVLTDINLMEYMDPNNPLLRKLSLEMPGTYQHSLVLGNIAENAAQSIGANGLLCRVATLFHDIGKLNNIHFFSENQGNKLGNVHQLLTPMESAQVIISHVNDGVMLAKKYHLPQAFIDLILEHHGTTLVYYFYHQELQKKGGDPSLVDEKMFRYPGPKPHSKEAVIIMISDAVEAASRSIEEPSEDSLKEMVNKVVADKLNDGQFAYSNLTFNELEKVKESIVQTLVVIRHVRVKYPEKTV